MWFGTGDGLNKFDGHDFTVYKHDLEDPSHRDGKYIYDLFQDKNGFLWIGTGSGLSRLDPKTGLFRHYKHDPENPDSLSEHSVWSIYEDRTGSLWLGTFGGLDLFEREANRFIHFRADPTDPSSLSNNFVVSLYEDRQGNFWIGTLDGLNLFDRARRTFRSFRHDPDDPHSLSNNQVRSIFQDSNDRLWIGTNGGGLNLFDVKNERFTAFRHDSELPGSLASDRVLTIMEDQDHVLWIGTARGLDRLEPGETRFRHGEHDPMDPYSLSHNTVFSIFQDRGGVIWVGGQDGINRFHRASQRFFSVTANPYAPGALNDRSVTAILQTASGELWLGTKWKGLNVLSPGAADFQYLRHDPDQADSLSHDRITVLYQDRAASIWAGTGGGGLNRFEPASGGFTHFRKDVHGGESSAFDVVTALFEDARGRFWMGSDGGGLALLDRDEDRFDSFLLNERESNSPENKIGVIYETRDGNLWLGALAGLARFDRETYDAVFYKHQAGNPRSLSHNMVLSLHEDLRGRFWVATNGGLNLFDRGQEQFIHYREKDGLSNDRVYGMLEDDSGFLWLSTGRGLSRFDPVTETFSNYGVDEGLQSNSFNKGALFRGEDGVMYFGGENGYTYFQPDGLTGNRHTPPIIITGFKRAGQDYPFDEDQELVLDHDVHGFSFEFVALDYANPARNQYAYYLEGVDRDWIHVGGRRYAAYNNIDPGRYVFHVKGSNNDGVWNEIGAALKVRIVPPFWDTWWFAALVVFFGVGLLVLIFIVQHKRLARRNNETIRNLELRRKTEELDFARKVQLSMLPQGDIDLDRVEIVGRMRTATEVGGDYYDFMPLDEDRYCIVCGDATGHGMSAGLIVGMTKAALINLIRQPDLQPTQHLLHDLNLTLYESITRRGIGMCLGVNLLCLKDLKLQVSSAGMPFPLWYRAEPDVLEALEMKCPPLGFMRTLPLEGRSLQLKAGDVLVFPTDGLGERRDRSGQYWSHQAMKSALRRICREKKSAAAIAEAFLEASDRFAEGREHEDDMTVVVIRVKP